MTSRLDVVPGVAMSSIPPSELEAEVLAMAWGYRGDEGIEGDKKIKKEAAHLYILSSKASA